MTVISKTRKTIGSLTYVLVTAARDEAPFIASTIESVLAQSIQPMKWVIVSDGSTDGTAEIVARYAARHKWIELIQLPTRPQRHFAGKAHAINLAVSRVQGLPYDAVANLDADVSLDKHHFAFLLRKLLENPSLGVVGTPFEDRSLAYDYRFVSIEHVSGPCQLFRRACFDDIGGYMPARLGGVDHIAVITARMKGWRTRTFMGTVYSHNRPMGSSEHGACSARFGRGIVEYSIGSHPLWELCRAAYQATKRPYVVGALMLLAGYVSASIRRVERPVSRDFVKFHRHEQLQRLRVFFGGLTAILSSEGDVRTKPVPARTLSSARSLEAAGSRSASANIYARGA